MENLAFICLAFFSTSALAADWKVLTVDGVTVKSRAALRSAIREYWAEATIGANLLDVQSALQDVEAHPSFMPYVVEVRILEAGESASRRRIYSRLEFPVVSSRDYALNVTVDKLASEVSDEFVSHWVSAPDSVPERSGVVRIRLNEGSWTAIRVNSHQTHLIYRFRVDPGGAIPAVIANEASRRGIPSVIRALEAEARKRGERRANSEPTGGARN